jgi:hypothetical protein
MKIHPQVTASIGGSNKFFASLRLCVKKKTRAQSQKKSPAIPRGCFQRRGIRAREKRSRESEGVHRSGEGGVKNLLFISFDYAIYAPWERNHLA